MAIRTLIVDDEPLAREGIRVLLDKHADFEIVGEAADGPRALEALEGRRPDLVFLDVQMPGWNGFDVLARIPPERMPVVVFVSAYDEYALSAFDVHALDYLLKPFDDERFARTLDLVRERIRQSRADELSQRLLSLVEDYRGRSGEPPLSRLAVRTGGRIYFLKVSEIDWIEAADYYVKLHVGGREHLLRETMSRLEERLDPRRFVRVHRSAIVQLDRVRELRTAGGGESRLVLEDGTSLKLSRSRRDRLEALLRNR